MIKTRFAPSPTGLIHLGNARTALFSYLFAKNAAGSFLLRIEDTDLERSETQFVSALEEDLQWLGLSWQEGGNKGGEHAPYYQSQRLGVYEEYYNRLLSEGLAYPCFCSEEQLALSRKLQVARGIAPRYAGTCRSLTPKEVSEKIASGLKPTLRFRIPTAKTIQFTDIVKGVQTFNTDDIGDFIIRRSNEMPSFMFCNAIDDALMGVTHALRGEDHLTNTPRQIMILQALGLRVPEYGHFSLILGADGSPLSKRNGSRSIKELRDLGYLPLAVVNYLARLGHYYESTDFLSIQALATEFKDHSLAKSPARYDEAQLKHWQRLALSALSEEDFWKQAGAALEVCVPHDKRELFLSTVKPNLFFVHEALSWAKLFFQDDYFIQDNERLVIDAAGPGYFKFALEVINDVGLDAKKFFNAMKQKLNITGKALYMPTRIALTGKDHGPEMQAIFDLLGIEKLVQRLGRLV